MLVAVVAVAMLAGIATAERLAEYRTSRRNHNALVVGLADPALRAQSEWSALLAGAILRSGTDAEKQSARQTLYRNLSDRWDGASIDISGGSVEAVTPLAGGLTAVLIVGHDSPNWELTLFDVGRERALWSIPLGGVFSSVEPVPGTTLVLAVGPSGVRVVDLSERSVRSLTDDRYDLAVAADAGHIAVARSPGLVARVDLESGRVVTTADRTVVLDLRRTASGAVRAVTQPAEDRYELLDPITGAILGTATLTESSFASVAAVLPDDGSAVIAGPGDQLWRMRPGEVPVATGGAVPLRTDQMLGLSGSRIAFDGSAGPPSIVHLPSGMDLGPLCAGNATNVGLKVGPDETFIACTGQAETAVTAPPDPPTRATELPLPAPALEVTNESLRVVANDKTLHISWRHRTTDPTEVHDLAAGGITSVAVSPDGSEALVGTATGEVRTLELGEPSAHVTSRWRSPDGSGVTRVGWGPGPVVETSSGWVWKVRSCPGCDTDLGLLALLRQRLRHCWSDRQLMWVDDATRRALGVSACRPRMPSGTEKVD